MQSPQEILDPIRKIVQALRRSSRHAEIELGLSGAQLMVLQLVRRNPGLSINELAHASFTHQSSVSAVVTRLTAKKLVERHTSAKDGRRSEIHLTPAGERTLSRSMPVAQEQLIEALMKFSAADQKVLSKLLKRWIEQAGLTGEPATLFFDEEES
jgi:DNA-binding MarR family transcriptional regulator